MFCKPYSKTLILRRFYRCIQLHYSNEQRDNLFEDSLFFNVHTQPVKNEDSVLNYSRDQCCESQFGEERLSVVGMLFVSPALRSSSGENFIECIESTHLHEVEDHLFQDGLFSMLN